MSLDEAAARDAISRHIAEPLGLGVEEAAAAIVELATEEMVGAIEEITVHQGLDPRSTVLVGAGGAAGLNIVAIASRLGCPRILIPETGAALSASGALLSELTAEFAVTCFTSSLDFDRASVARAYATLQERCDAFFARFPAETVRTVDFSYEGRYPRQNWEIEVQLPSTADLAAPEPDVLVASFHDAHRRVFALADELAPVEFVSWRARARAQMRLRERRLARDVRSGPATRRRQIWLAGEGWAPASVVDFDALPEGDQVFGPAVAESSFTTVVLTRATVAWKSRSGNLVIDLETAA
jgi:N-methylhydantoinase A